MDLCAGLPLPDVAAVLALLAARDDLDYVVGLLAPGDQRQVEHSGLKAGLVLEAPRRRPGLGWLLPERSALDIEDARRSGLLVAVVPPDRGCRRQGVVDDRRLYGGDPRCERAHGEIPPCVMLTDD